MSLLTGRFPWNTSIRRKLTLIIMGTTMIALGLISVAFITYDRLKFREALVHDLTTQADIIGNQSEALLPFDFQKEAAEILRAYLTARPEIVAAAIYKAGTDKPLAGYLRRDSQSEILPPHAGASGAVFDGEFLVLFQPILSQKEVIGTVYLKSDLRQSHERLVRYVQVVGLFTLGSALVALVLALSLQGAITRPVLHLAETARAVTSGKNYGVRAVKHGEDEVGQLIVGFNEMLSQIQSRDAALQKARDELEKRVEERTRELQQEVVERTRAEEAARQQVERISLLNQITRAVAERQDLQSIIQVVLQQLEDHLPVDYGTVYSFDPRNRILNVLARSPKAVALAAKLGLPEVLPVDQTPFEACLRGEQVYVPDGAMLPFQVSQKMAQAGFASVIGAPLTVENRMFGVMVVVRRRVDAFSAAECEFLRGLGGHVVLAVHQAQLYEDLQKAYNDLRQAQQGIMQQQRLQALGEMASGIAHDINNALSPILAFTEVLIRIEPNLSKDGKKFLGHIRTSGEDIAQTVTRMREFYRRRDQHEPRAAVQLNSVVQEVIELTRPRWRDIPQSRGVVIEMQTAIAPNLPEIAGNSSELREAVTNLIINAVDAMPAGGQMIIRTRMESPAFPAARTNARPRIVLEVRDGGVGMDTETRRRCLEPFFSTKGQHGTGLGLSMVYGIVERHEGRIEIESAVGVGTTMRLIFPPCTLSGRELDPDVPAATAPPPMRILCVDDEPMVRESLHELLGSDGHKVFAADSGRKGLESFQEAIRRGAPFDVVITDLGMPYLDGRQVAQTIKDISPATPVIMLTGWGSVMKSEDVPPNTDAFLSKPPRLNELREALWKVRGKAGPENIS